MVAPTVTTPRQQLYSVPLTYRRVTGSGLTINPPVVSSPLVNGNFSIGAAAISVRVAAGGTGQLNVGDSFTIGAAPQVYTVTGTAAITTTGTGLSTVYRFASISFSPSLVAGAADGAAVNFSFLADHTTDVNGSTLVSQVSSYSAYLINGTSILTGDLRVRLPATAINFVPTGADKIILPLDAHPRTVVNYRPRYFNGSLRNWDIQVR